MIIDNGVNNILENVSDTDEICIEIYGDNNHLDFTSAKILNSKFVINGNNNEILIGWESYFSG